MSNLVQKHYQNYPYPQYPLIASVRLCDTYALNLDALWCRFNAKLPPPAAKKILLAGCGAFAPYPWSVANHDAKITALDLSEPSLRRARLHCLLHGRRNVDFICGDLLDKVALSGEFGLIDSYGVLHHLDDPLSGLKSLEAMLLDGGILRIMVYSRYARREEESIRRALRLLRISTPAQFRRLLDRAKAESRLANFMAASGETDTDAGIADALLHPQVQTFRIDGLMDMIRQTSLQPLLFAHQDALDDVQEEIRRLQKLEKDRLSPGNFIVYLGKSVVCPCGSPENNMIMLNPCLTAAVSPYKIGSLHIPTRTGNCNPALGHGERRFLRRFITPVRRSDLTPDLSELVDVYKRTLFLMEYAA
ncbi:MAG: methyltransferase domain-containing protein [Deltaproteobacteria bacterium]